MFKKILLVLILLISYKVDANDRSMVIDISQQRLYLYQGKVLEASFPVSSSKYGEGSKENSFKTPLGEHIIKEMIGEGAKINTIFSSRINTTRPAKVINEAEDSKNDYVTSRIMWLDGLEDGKNKGGNVDSYKRYIYIHGTHEEGLIGSKASHGCIRMFNEDVIELFDMVKIGTKVLIKA
jgi:lipoprotein-anchoring transpeptidase ErfK/SrfK